MWLMVVLFNIALYSGDGISALASFSFFLFYARLTAMRIDAKTPRMHYLKGTNSSSLPTGISYVVSRGSKVTQKGTLGNHNA